MESEHAADERTGTLPAAGVAGAPSDKGEAGVPLTTGEAVVPPSGAGLDPAGFEHRRRGRRAGGER